MSEECPFQSPCNFLGLSDEEASAERARAWVLPVPYEASATYGKGTRNGPAAIIAASQQVELFYHEFGSESAVQYGVYTMDSLIAILSSPQAMIEVIEETVAGILSGKPRPEVLALLGGEHTISAGAVRGLARAVSSREVVAVQVDAHADLRNEYEDSPFSHACIARRMLEVCPVFQIGIRNISAEGDSFRRGCDRVRTVFADESAAADRGFLKDLGAFVRGKQVYFTVDLDGLDPSIMPAVGTPEPGGISWERILEIAQVVCKESAHVPIFDVVELAPIPGLIAPDFLAAKLVYKIMSYIMLGRSTRKM
ncbi:MAG: agmatinase [Planctomycetota bacterium]|nr:MAG: agmatinase [Planctomycetota bacterium]